MQRTEHHASFGGRQEVWQHDSTSTGTPMKFGIYLPPQALAGQKCPVLYWLSGLTCTEQNFITKAGAQQWAAQHGLVIVAPDTSPRGEVSGATITSPCCAAHCCAPALVMKFCSVQVRPESQYSTGHFCPASACGGR